VRARARRGGARDVALDFDETSCSDHASDLGPAVRAAAVDASAP
jgi:hypothetical protein